MKSRNLVIGIIALVVMFGIGTVMAQLNQSGGASFSGTVTSNQGTANATPWNQNLAQIAGSVVSTAASGIMKVGLTDGSGNSVNSTSNALNVNLSSGSIANTAFALNSGSAIVGFVRMLPSSCSQTTPFANSTVGVAITTGTTVTSTTTCVTFAYANNITNSAVTLRLADRQGTPVIWLGGNADFSIPANSNMRIPIEGVTFTSGLTAIAGTGSALNLQINGMQ